MKSFVTSYNGLFAHLTAEAPRIARVEIPMIQRDYAQGRQSGAVERIRERFLDVLFQAVTQGQHVSLDFVYGDVDDEGTLRPLDGQQRLTTLFLLHWYLAYRADQLDAPNGWKHFTYATRPGARLFCQRLVESRPPDGVERPSVWLEDQPWYLYTWRHDPTIQSMLVMLDAIHTQFVLADCAAAWTHLIDLSHPAISFHLLPMEQSGLSEDLYIKMNSRGKPLTPFESFKARFEQTLDVSCPERVGEFALKIDGVWSDVLWSCRDDDLSVDDAFLRYLHFVTELCEWREELLNTDRFEDRADRIFGPHNPRASEHLDLLFHAFDTWVGVDIAATFEGLFTPPPQLLEPGEPSRLVLFSQPPDLFDACCRSYGDARRSQFGLSHTLLLYAVLLHRRHDTPNFTRWVRVLRNLIEASSNEVRLAKMPALILDVEQLVLRGDLDSVKTFNQAQVADEHLKLELLTRSPELTAALFHLEDHPLLRGSIVAFDLDAEAFPRRAAAFHEIFSTPDAWPTLTGALLAIGDYARRQKNHRMFQLGSGSNEAPWRELLTGTARSQLKNTRDVLGQLLDRVALARDNASNTLEAIQKEWLLETAAASGFDWRYYLVKYPCMRKGRSGIYAGSNGTMGYSLCMLNGQKMNGYYRDPYLLAILDESGVIDAVKDPWFQSYESNPRWLRLIKSGAELRCVDEGLSLRFQSSASESHVRAFERVCKEHGVSEDLVLLIPQVTHNTSQVDQVDRVVLGAKLLRDLVAAGL